MGTNGFREDELVSRKVKVGNEWQTRIFPIIGGRLRLAHEGNETLSLQTEMVNWDGQYAIFKCSAITNKGQFVGYGTANSQRDARLAESLVELAETRSIARALRFAGFGLEFTGAEEVSHVAATESETEQTTGKESKPAFPEENQNNKPEAKPVNDKSNGDGSKATQAQVRAIRNIAFNRNRMSEQDLVELITEYGVKDIPDLSRQAASDVIQSLQAQAA
jgi:hypothetical protein